MQKVYVLDNVGTIIFEAILHDDHYYEMIRRNWITYNNWLKNETITVINSDKFIDFIYESSIM